MARIFTFVLSFFLVSTEANEGGKKVLWVPFEGTVELGLSPYIERAIDYADENNYDAIILEVDTFGGRVDAAVNIRDHLLDSKTLTVAWVNKRAISAGALISLACKKIFFASGSTMGAATPIQLGAQGAEAVENKFVSYFRAEMGSTAERNGRNKKIAESMVKASEEIKGLVAKDDVLTLTDQSALDTKISDGTKESEEEILEALNLKGAAVDRFEINWAEKIVRFLTEPTVSGLLMSGGALGIFLELQSPGFGLPGILGITCLALYFGAKFIVHLAGLEEILLFLLGLILIGLEILVIPGTFVAGTIGIVLMFVALLMAGISPKIPLDWNMPHLDEQVRSVTFTLGLTIIGFIAIYFWMMKNPRRMPLVLSSEGDKAHGYISHPLYLELVGKAGVTTTDLRPAGKVMIEEKIYDVVTDGNFISKGQEIEVVRVEDVKILVKPREVKA